MHHNALAAIAWITCCVPAAAQATEPSAPDDALIAELVAAVPMIHYTDDFVSSFGPRPQVACVLRTARPPSFALGANPFGEPVFADGTVRLRTDFAAAADDGRVRMHVTHEASGLPVLICTERHVIVYDAWSNRMLIATGHVQPYIRTTIRGRELQVAWGFRLHAEAPALPFECQVDVREALESSGLSAVPGEAGPALLAVRPADGGGSGGRILFETADGRPRLVLSPLAGEALVRLVVVSRRVPTAGLLGVRGLNELFNCETRRIPLERADRDRQGAQLAGFAARTVLLLECIHASDEGDASDRRAVLEQLAQQPLNWDVMVAEAETDLRAFEDWLAEQPPIFGHAGG